jgi:hypothetical protein
MTRNGQQKLLWHGIMLNLEPCPKKAENVFNTVEHEISEILLNHL